MGRLFRITAAYILCVILLVLALERLSHGRDPDREQRTDLAVSTSVTTVRPTKQLQEESLVETLTSVSAQLPISRVSWSDTGTLSLDISVASSIHNPWMIYEELYRWLYFSFYETDNVNRLELRVVIENKQRHQKHVLLALDTMREQVTESIIHEFVTRDSYPSTHTLKALRLSYTTLWAKQFGGQGGQEKMSPSF